MSDLPGFSSLDTADPNDESIDSTKRFKKTSGFHSLGLNQNVLRGLIKRGYKQPTPIQRKTIPLILDGRDVVAMARTGSGKTACFLIPMFEKLKVRSAKTGARALIFSPTRELALQTLKFIKELGRFVGLKTTVILGGDSMDDQFSAIHGNPDVIVATPGRFLHVCVEMELKLTSIEYVVFDEADRLFEMGLSEQLTEIVTRLPDARQTVLFSATMPKLLVDFAKAGLSDPVLIRLDVESKIPPELELHFITVRPDERVAALLVLLKNIIDATQQTIIFAATRHHVEYIHMILDQIGIQNTYIYSNLDPTARKINAAKFSTGKVRVLVVTDVAARGIDIPKLDNVINYNFPAKAKLFVHRVGRCARAGRSGTAFSLVAPDEYAYLLDLHMFLGRSATICSLNNKSGTIGKVPQALLEEQQNSLLVLHENSIDLVNMRKVTINAYQQYSKSRPAASVDSNKKIKELPFGICSLHPIFRGLGEDVEAREQFLDKMKNYRPNSTIFEICAKNKSQEYQVMKQKKQAHKDKIQAHHQIIADKEKSGDLIKTPDSDESMLVQSSQDQISGVFREIVMPKKRKLENLYRDTKFIKKFKDDNYIPYVPSDKVTEDGFAVNNFHKDASQVQFEITGDSDEMLRKASQMKKWDRKKKKMITVVDKRVGKIKTESGVWIPATYKSNRYAQWREKSKIAERSEEGEGEEVNSSLKPRWFKHNKKVGKQKTELKTADEVLKARKIAEKKKSRQKKGKRGSKNKHKK